jgi:integrase
MTRSTPPASTVAPPTTYRHTFATEALAAGLSIFELARIMGASVKEIDRTYRQLARDANDSIRSRLEARAAQPGVNLASAERID